MTIDEAIKHCLDVAEGLEKKANTYGIKQAYIPKSREPVDCIYCAADHRQLAEWLMELKDLRAEQNDQYVFIHELMSELKELKERIAADVQHVKHGHWIEQDMYYVCSNCKHEFLNEILGIAIWENGVPYFCPWCGADMKEGE